MWQRLGLYVNLRPTKVLDLIHEVSRASGSSAAKQAAGPTFQPWAVQPEACLATPAVHTAAQAKHRADLQLPNDLGLSKDS